MNNEKPLSIQRDEERLRNLAPRRDAGPTSEADIWNGTPQARDAQRVRQVRRAQLADWWKRRYGKPATEAELDTLEGGR